MMLLIATSAAAQTPEGPDLLETTVARAQLQLAQTEREAGIFRVFVSEELGLMRGQVLRLEQRVEAVRNASTREERAAAHARLALISDGVTSAQMLVRATLDGLWHSLLIALGCIMAAGTVAVWWRRRARRRGRPSPAILLLLSLSLPACGGKPLDSRDRGDEEAAFGPVRGEVRVRVESAVELSSMEDLRPAPGNMFVVLQVQLANGLDEAIIAGPAAFRLRTHDGLETLASPASLLLHDACPAEALLGTGQMVACQVAFDIPYPSVPTAAVYAMPSAGVDDLIVAEAPIDRFDRCTRCGGGCVDLATSTHHCGACGVGVPSGGHCVEGVPSCTPLTACGDRCVDITTDPKHCGACNTGYLGGACHDGQPLCPNSESLCGAECVDLSASHAHCGLCDRAVPEHAWCANGNVKCDAAYTMCNASCVDTRTDEDHCGACDQACPSGFQCTADSYYLPHECRRAGNPEVGESCSSACSAMGAECIEAKYYNMAGWEWFDVHCMDPRQDFMSSYACQCRHVFP